MNYLAKAIQRLKPTAEFSFTENDYSTIKWDVLDGEAPTQSEIDAAIKEIKAEEKSLEKKAESDKVAVQAKLGALGLTSDDLKALGL